jgi:uncharacterized protein
MAAPNKSKTPVRAAAAASRSVSRSDSREALAVAETQHRIDGWSNVFTGMGQAGLDRRVGSRISWEPMSEQEADNLYAGSDTAGKIVDELVVDAFREGYTLKAEEWTPELDAAITDEGARLSVDEKIQEAWTHARVYGGSGIILMPRDLTKLDTPFVPSAVSEVLALLVLTRYELAAGSLESDIRSPNYGKPTYYTIQQRSGQASGSVGERVHYTRVLRFDGQHLPKSKLAQNQYWHDSVLNKCKTAIRDYDAALAAVSATLDDFSVAVMKVNGLQRLIAEDKDDAIIRRMQIANLSRSVSRTIMLDAEKEEYVYQERSLAGIDGAVRLIAGRLVVASNMPHTKILGESPDGSNATGNSTTQDWYSFVRGQQEKYLDFRLITLWKWILSAKSSPTKGAIPKGFKAIYAPLWQESDGEIAKARFAQAQADQIYVQTGVLDPEEVAISRFGSDEYSFETQLSDDRETRSGEPEPPPEPPTDGEPPAKPFPVEK